MTAVNLIARTRYDGNVWNIHEVVVVTDAELVSIPDEDLDDGFFDWVAWDLWERAV